MTDDDDYYQQGQVGEVPPPAAAASEEYADDALIASLMNNNNNDDNEGDDLEQYLARTARKGHVEEEEDVNNFNYNDARSNNNNNNENDDDENDDIISMEDFQVDIDNDDEIDDDDDARGDNENDDDAVGGGEGDDDDDVDDDELVGYANENYYDNFDNHDEVENDDNGDDNNYENNDNDGEENNDDEEVNEDNDSNDNDEDEDVARRDMFTLIRKQEEEYRQRQKHNDGNDDDDDVVEIIERPLLGIPSAPRSSCSGTALTMPLSTPATTTATTAAAATVMGQQQQYQQQQYPQQQHYQQHQQQQQSYQQHAPPPHIHHHYPHHPHFHPHQHQQQLQQQHQLQHLRQLPQSSMGMIPLPPPTTTTITTATALPFTIPPTHTSTWKEILPQYICQHHPHGIPKMGSTPVVNSNNNNNIYNWSTTPRRIILSLINMWEFTITIEPKYITQGMGGGGGNYGITTTMRAQIKKIAKEHVGKDGRFGAIYERGAGIESMSDDPLLREQMSDSTTVGNVDATGGGGGGKWRIPLGAYQSLYSYLFASKGQRDEIIPIPYQTRNMATIGRERMDKKSHTTVDELLLKNVAPTVARSLAPYQRTGVHFILERNGRALLADEMGLGKTVQAIAAMSAYANTDWPLLVLCPSTARYHWEIEFRHWMGVGSMARVVAEEEEAAATAAAVSTSTARSDGREREWEGDDDDIHISRGEEGGLSMILQNEQINVLTKGTDEILLDNSTRVVICSIGLIVNLTEAGKIHEGMFRSIIVDESHLLKNKDAKRTKVVLPLLMAAERCLLLSGTPAFAKPSELWPQLSALKRQNDTETGIWCDEDKFMSDYTRKGDMEGNKAKLAELHTLLTSTVMIRRMKADILKNLPSKIREKAFISIEDENLRNEFVTYMQILRQGKGVLGKLARVHHQENKPRNGMGYIDSAGHNNYQMDDGIGNKEVLHHLYKTSGRSKVQRITTMLRGWLKDNTKGKLCIFAHHLEVLDDISNGASLSNEKDSTTRYIRIDGSTSPKARQDQIMQFQNDPAVRIAMLGITAAGVAVTLTASSTVWFAELFWTPAIMIQAEDRCHRIGQQARVRCLYFIAKGTLDEVLWRLIEKKFRDLGEFVEGKENMGIALERELEDDEHDEILKNEENDVDVDESNLKRKSQDTFSELMDTEDLGLTNEIDELIHEEEDMLKIKNEDEEDDPDIDDKLTYGTSSTAVVSNPVSSREVVELSDDDDVEIKPFTIALIQKRYRESRVFDALKIDPLVELSNVQTYTVNYPGPTYGLIMVSCSGRVVVKSHQTDNNLLFPTKVGAIIVGVNGFLLPLGMPFTTVLKLMKELMKNPPVSVIFADDDDFISYFVEDFTPMILVHKAPAVNNGPILTTAMRQAVGGGLGNGPSIPVYSGHQAPMNQNTDVIDLLDD